MTFLFLILGLAVAYSGIMAAGWQVQQTTGNNGWADVFWTYGLGVLGVVAALYPFEAAGAPAPRQWLVAGLTALWSLRLGTHIAIRSANGGDDPRYKKLREEWGDAAPRKMFQFLQVQAFGSLPLVIAVLLAAHNPRSGLDWQDALGAVIVLVAIGGEWLSDTQLRAFAKDPANKGKVCDVGLWAWSRHPNYFFEFLGWVGYPVIAVSLDGGYLWGWLAFAAPALIYHFLVNVSGIPPLEEHMLRTRGDAFRDYQARTSAFFPLPPSSQPASSR